MNSKNELLLEPAQALADTVRLINQCRIPYFLVGSFASGIRGEFRATNDIDLVLKFSKQTSAVFLKSASDTFIVDSDSSITAIRLGKSFNLIHEETFTKIDIFTTLTELEENELSRATEVQIPGSSLSVRVATTEYNIIAKLRWYLKSNKVLDRQLRDIKSMVEINRESLDVTYLSDWASTLGFADELDRQLS